MPDEPTRPVQSSRPESSPDATVPHSGPSSAPVSGPVPAPTPGPVAGPARADNGSGRSGPRPRRTAGRAVRRDRRGRGLRTPLLPAEAPGSRSRAQQFDHAVLEAVADLEEQWEGGLDGIEFAVDEVPPLPAGPVLPGSEVVLDGGVPLTRFLPPGVDQRGRPTKARIVVYRRPLEVRSVDPGDLSDLVAEVLSEQVSAILGNPGDGPGSD